MKRILVLCLCLMLLVCGCFAERKNRAELQEEIEMLQAQNEQLNLELVDLRSELQENELERDHLTDELDRYRFYYHDLVDRNSGLVSEYMTALDYHVIEHPDKAQAYLALGSVPVRGLPLEKATVIGELNQALVTAYFTIQGENDVLWSLVNLPNLAENMDTLGWVKWEDLKEYDEFNGEKIWYPVKVKPGVKLFDDQRNILNYSDGEQIYMIKEVVRYDFMYLADSGGLSYAVNRDDLIYPSVRDGKIVWD